MLAGAIGCHIERDIRDEFLTADMRLVPSNDSCEEQKESLGDPGNETIAHVANNDADQSSRSHGG